MCPQHSPLSLHLLILVGQPTVQYDIKHPAYPVLQSIGKEITQMKPTAVVVFSAHWQAGRNDIEVNSAESTDLIYE